VRSGSSGSCGGSRFMFPITWGVVANTDLLVIVPERVAEVLSRENKVKVVACPIALPAYQVKLHWHERYVGDPANMWLRGTISRLFYG